MGGDKAFETTGEGFMSEKEGFSQPEIPPIGREELS